MGVSARPSSFKTGGGGFLNGVDAVIEDYEFTPEFPFPSSGPKKKSDWHPLYCVLTVAVDGAEESQQTTLMVGSADDFDIEDDGKTLKPVDESGGLRANSEFSSFILSLCEAGFPENSLPDDKINYEAILGTRVRLVQERDEALTKRIGKKKAKNGKEYDRTRLKVENVLALAGKGGKPSAAKGKAVVNESNDDDVTTLATQSLIAVLKKAPGKTLNKKKLPVQIINQVGAKHPQRAEVKELVTSDDFLSSEDGWSYDSDSGEVALN